MNKLQKISCLISLILLTASCYNQQINIAELLDKKEPIKLTKNIQTIRIIEPLSEKWNKFIDFAEQNKNGWKPSPVTYLPEITVSQKEFRLFYWIDNNFIVINFIDKNGNSKQFVKNVKKGALNFLVE